MNVRIGDKIVGEDNECFVALEPSATFRNFEEAKEMIKASSKAGAHAIKFQTFLPGDASRIISDKDIKIEFRTNTGQKEESILDILKERELSKDEWHKLRNYSKENNLSFITSPYFIETVDFLNELSVDAIKISKGDINNVLLIESAAKTGLPIILDAREKLDDINEAIRICKENKNEQIVILHCPSGYPADSAGINLQAIEFLKTKYEYPIGFADHSEGGMMNFVAIGFGAKMIEKTITMNKNTEKIEHLMSLEVKELQSFMNNLREIDSAIGNSDVLKVSRVEENVRRSLVSKRDIKKGELISKDMIDFKRPGDSGISCAEGFKILSYKAKNAIPKDTFIKWDMLDE